MNTEKNEDLLEQAYWLFDARKAKGNEGERDSFKHAIRQIFPELFTDNK